MTRYRGIRSKSLRISIPLMLSLSLLAGTLFTWYAFESTIETLNRKVDDLSRAYAMVLAEPVWNMDTAGIAQILFTLQLDPDVRGAVVFDSDGVQLGKIGQLDQLELAMQPGAEANGSVGVRHLFRHLVRGLLSFGDASAYAELRAELDPLLRRATGLTFRTDGGPRQVGRVVLALTGVPTIDEFVRLFYSTLGLMVVIGLSVFGSILFGISRTVLRPLRLLHESVTASRDAGASRTVTWPGRDEIGDLITEYNGMLEARGQFESRLQEGNERLEESLAERQQLIQNANVPIFAVDRFGHITVWNGILERLTGHPADEALGCNLLNEFVHPEQREQVGEIMQRSLAGEDEADFQLRVVNRNRSELLLALHTSCQWDRNGNVTGVIGIGPDITERARLEAQRERLFSEIRDQRRLLTDFLDSSPAAIWMVGMDDRMLGANVSCRRWLIEADGPVEDAPMADLLPEPLLARLRFPREEVACGNRSVEFESRIERRDGSQIEGQVQVLPIHDHKERVRAIGFVIRDITELKQSREAVRQAAKLSRMGEMSTMIAHELNQPLHVIRLAAAGVARRLKRGELESEFLTAKLQRIDQQVQRGAEIIKHMRMFGRVDAAQREVVNPADVLEDALMLCGEQLRIAGLLVEREYPSEPLYVDVVPVELETVFLNLISNARQATEGQDSSRLRLRVSATGQRVTIGISDNGVGIPPEARPHVFEPFFSTREVGQGKGLGLAVCYGIVTECGGEIHVDDDVHGGHGTTVTIRLPRAEPIVAEGAEGSGRVTASHRHADG